MAKKKQLIKALAHKDDLLAEYAVEAGLVPDILPSPDYYGLHNGRRTMLAACSCWPGCEKPAVYYTDTGEKCRYYGQDLADQPWYDDYIEALRADSQERGVADNSMILIIFSGEE